MRVVFLGSPTFAVPSLISLAEHEDVDVKLVVTQPDRPAGRGRTVTAPPVKTAALDLGLHVFQPESLRDDDKVDVLRATNPDILIVVAYGELLRRNVLELAPAGCLNVHPSLLPTYRGAAPIPAAILNGDPTTGVSIIKLVRTLDAGPIVAQRELGIEPADTTGSLSERLAVLAAEMLPDVAFEYLAGELPPISQDDRRATYTREWTTDDARIDWTAPAVQIERLVRAANPWPVAWTTYGNTRLRILSALVTDDAVNIAIQPGLTTLTSGRVVVATAAGGLQLDVVQPAGKRSMAAADWWRGTRRATAQLGPSLADA